MVLRLKTFLKKTMLWKKIIGTDFYRKLKYPVTFKKFRDELKFYDNFLRTHPAKNNLIFDVGANRGTKSFIFSKLCKTVYAFEPSENLYLFLQDKFKNSNVKVLKYALGSQVTELDLYLVENNEAYNSLNIKHIETTATKRGISNIDSVKVKKVKVERLEKFIMQFGVPKYIKIDVEGYEYEVLLGLETPVPLLSFEVNLPEFSEEAVNALEYLDDLSKGKYKYNYSTNNSLILEKFIGKDEMINITSSSSFSYMEIYCNLKE